MALQSVHSLQPTWDEQAWDAFVAAHAYAHPLQLHAWGTLKRAWGWRDVRWGLKEGDQWVAGAQILLRPLPRFSLLPFSIAYIPKGPLCDWSDPQQVQRVFAGLHRFCRRLKAVMLRIEPEWPDSLAHATYLRHAGFVPSQITVQPRTTVWLDVAADDDAILGNMKQKWRYNVRLAARKGVRVRLGTATDLPVFGRLMQETSQRNAFGVHPPAYYEQFWRLFAPADRAALLIAEHEGVALAAIMVAQLAGKAYYFYGASGNSGRNLMPNHALQWSAMQWAKAHGCSRYDLWGIPDAVGMDAEATPPDPVTGLWGVWRFKQGFGGEVVRYVGAWDRYYVPGSATVARRLGFA